MLYRVWIGHNGPDRKTLASKETLIHAASEQAVRDLIVKLDWYGGPWPVREGCPERGEYTRCIEEVKFDENGVEITDE